MVKAQETFGPEGSAAAKDGATAVSVRPVRCLGLIFLAGSVLAGNVGVAAAVRGGEQIEQISYRLEPTPSNMNARYAASQLATLEKLNRADVRHLSSLEVLVVPDRWDATDLEYSPFPGIVAGLSEHRKALIVHQPAQVFGAYEYGRLVRWGPVSTGRRANPTPAGQFNLNWKSRGHRSTVNPAWYMEWYFNFEPRRGLALHQYDLPGRPASHACIRLLERDARWLFEWGEVWELDRRGEIVHPGTPLWILGGYDFAAGPPWLTPHSPHPPVEIEL